MIWGKKQESTNKETGETYSYFQILFVFNNSQVDRTVRNFKENYQTDENGKIIPDNIPEGDLPF
jgi:hypothetical protein